MTNFLIDRPLACARGWILAILATASIGAFAQSSVSVSPGLASAPAPAASSPDGMVAGLDVAKERERIVSEREKAAATLLAAEKICYQKFLVSDCLADARAKNRVVLADIRRQELSLNDAERRKKGAEQMKSLDQRQTPEVLADRERKRLQALADDKARRESAASKAADRASHAQTDADRTKQTTDKVQARDRNLANRAEKANNTASNVEAQPKRVREAAEHRAKRAEANAERAKSGKVAAPLPDPSSTQ